MIEVGGADRATSWKGTRVATPAVIAARASARVVKRRGEGSRSMTILRLRLEKDQGAPAAAKRMPRRETPRSRSSRPYACGGAASASMTA